MKYCEAISIDLKKEFDFISHALLIIMLEKYTSMYTIYTIYGFKRVALQLLISFLNINQCVTFNNYISQIKNIKFGVSQGSVLCPLLFFKFINDIVNIKIQGHILLFTDDTSIIFHENDIDLM